MLQCLKPGSEHTSVLGLFLHSHRDTEAAESIPSSAHSAAISDTLLPCHKKSHNVVLTEKRYHTRQDIIKHTVNATHIPPQVHHIFAIHKHIIISKSLAVIKMVTKHLLSRFSGHGGKSASNSERLCLPNVAPCRKERERTCNSSPWNHSLTTNLNWLIFCLISLSTYTFKEHVMQVCHKTGDNDTVTVWASVMNVGKSQLSWKALGDWAQQTMMAGTLERCLYQHHRYWHVEWQHRPWHHRRLSDNSSSVNRPPLHRQDTLQALDCPHLCILGTCYNHVYHHKRYTQQCNIATVASLSTSMHVMSGGCAVRIPGTACKVYDSDKGQLTRKSLNAVQCAIPTWGAWTSHLFWWNVLSDATNKSYNNDDDKRIYKAQSTSSDVLWCS